MILIDPIHEDHLIALRKWKHFDAGWYLEEYQDVRLLGLDPAYHYLWIGAKIGRKPSAGFSRFPGRSYNVDELVREIQNGRFSDQIIFDDAPHGAHLRRHPAEFVDPGGIDVAVVQSIRVAVHAHMYYADLAEEFAGYLGRIPCMFDLYVSTANEAGRISVSRIFSAIPNVQIVDVRVVPNIGRDIAPFIVEFGKELSKYDVVGHIQTKKSLYNSGKTDGWREYILNSLFEDPARIALFLRALNDRRYGIIYPQCFYNVPYMAHTWLANAGLARHWANRFGIGAVPEGYFDFPAGSMFWARADAVQPLLEAGLDWSDFPPEQAQTDGTLAHCIERMFGVVPTSRHFQHGVIRDNQWPSWSRWRLNQFIDRPLDHLHAMIEDRNTKVVAFDIFDTLLTRPFLDADYVKWLLHAENEKGGVPGFRELRMRSEGAAREAKGLDVDIHDIYRHLCDRLESAASLLTPGREIELETHSVRPRSEVVALMRFAAEKGKKIVLASDMFLPRNVIEDMLERCGIKDWSAFYLSCEMGIRKDSGKLYDHILRKEEIEPSQMVMVGDNERSDFQIPADMGIRTIHVVKPVNIMRAMPRLGGLVPDAAEASVEDQFLFGAIASENFGAISFPDFSPDDMFGASAHAIGYGLLGPIVAAFSQWALDQARKNGLKRLYFLAREGKFLKAAFDCWQSDQADTLRSEYLLVSRRAVTVPCVETLEDIVEIASANNFYGAPMAMFLNERFGVVLDDSIWTECERKKLWHRTDPLSITDGGIDHIRPFLTFLAPYIFEQAREERENALKYFQRKDVAADECGAVIDVGYGATIQKHLINLLDTKIHGLYMMTDRRGQALGDSAKVLSRGCFVNGAERSPAASPLFIQSFLLEKMLSADDEQVIRYTPSGTAEFREGGDYLDIGKQVRHGLQQGAMKFVKDAVRFRKEMSGSLHISRTRCEELFAHFVSGMSSTEKRIFSELALDDFYCGRGIVSDQ